MGRYTLCELKCKEEFITNRSSSRLTVWKLRGHLSWTPRPTVNNAKASVGGLVVATANLKILNGKVGLDERAFRIKNFCNFPSKVTGGYKFIKWFDGNFWMASPRDLEFAALYLYCKYKLVWFIAECTFYSQTWIRPGRGRNNTLQSSTFER